jgi:hypothetical protein
MADFAVSPCVSRGEGSRKRDRGVPRLAKHPPASLRSASPYCIGSVSSIVVFSIIVPTLQRGNASRDAPASQLRGKAPGNAPASPPVLDAGRVRGVPFPRKSVGTMADWYQLKNNNCPLQSHFIGETEQTVPNPPREGEGAGGTAISGSSIPSWDTGRPPRRRPWDRRL